MQREDSRAQDTVSAKKSKRKRSTARSSQTFLPFQDPSVGHQGACGHTAELRVIGSYASETFQKAEGEKHAEAALTGPTLYSREPDVLYHVLVRRCFYLLD